MKLGKILARGLGAGLEGYGKGLIMQAEVDEKRRQSQALFDREVALANHRAGQAETLAENNSKRSVSVYEQQKGIDVAALDAEMKVKAPYAREERQAKTQEKLDEEARANKEWRERARIGKELEDEFRPAPEAKKVGDGVDEKGNVKIIYDMGGGKLRTISTTVKSVAVAKAAAKGDGTGLAGLRGGAKLPSESSSDYVWDPKAGLN